MTWSEWQRWNALPKIVAKSALCPLCEAICAPFQLDYCHRCDIKFRWRRGLSTLVSLEAAGVVVP